MVYVRKLMKINGIKIQENNEKALEPFDQIVMQQCVCVCFQNLLSIHHIDG